MILYRFTYRSKGVYLFSFHLIIPKRQFLIRLFFCFAVGKDGAMF